MAQFISPYQKRQKKLMIILAVVFFIIVLVLYFGFWKPSGRGPTAPPETMMPGGPPEAALPGAQAPSSATPSSISSSFLATIKFDIDFLKSDKFLSLKVFGDIPPKVEEKGRQNPFLPY